MARATRILIYSWKGGMGQARPIADAIENCFLIRRTGSQYKYRKGDVIINWGSSVRPEVLGNCLILNDPSKVGHGKIAQYKLFKKHGIPTVEWTESHVTAQGWLDGGRKVLSRSQNHGMGGHGIKVYKPGEQIDDNAKFYVKYRKKERELRYHVWQGKVIFIQEKKKVKDNKDADPYIRSHGRGWCFAFHHFGDNPPPVGLEDLAINAVKCSGLDFGAVDIGWNVASGGFVFEVNTAPGIENSSLAAYVNTIKNLEA